MKDHANLRQLDLRAKFIGVMVKYLNASYYIHEHRDYNFAVINYQTWLKVLQKKSCFPSLTSKLILNISFSKLVEQAAFDIKVAMVTRNL